jgi:glycosyltransferase involved in cell wall biosynthesis
MVRLVVDDSSIPRASRPGGLAHARSTLRNWIYARSKADPTAVRRPRIGIIDHHYADYTLGFASALQADCDVALALSIEGMRELTPCNRDRLGRLSRLRIYNPVTKIGEVISFFSLLIFMITAKVDIVIVHENGQFHSPAVLAVLSFLRCPIYLIVHDPKPHSGSDATAAGKRAGRIALERRLATVCLVHGQFCADLLRQVLPHKQILSIIHGPVLVDPSIQSTPSKFAEILLFGRMQFYKGVDILLEAAESLVKNFPSLRIHLAGRGPELERLSTSIVRLGENIIVHDGFIDPADLIGYIRSAWCVVLPYRDATQSGVIAGAFGNGRPVIASDVGAIAEVVQDGLNGLLVMPNSVEALTIALRRFLEDAALRARLESGVLATEGALSWSVAARRVLDHAGLERRAVPETIQDAA